MTTSRKDTGRGDRLDKLYRAVAAAKLRPGEWQPVTSYDSAAVARSCAAHLRRRQKAGVPPGCELRTRTEGTRGVIEVRWVWVAVPATPGPGEPT